LTRTLYKKEEEGGTDTMSLSQRRKKKNIPVRIAWCRRSRREKKEGKAHLALSGGEKGRGKVCLI